MVPDESSEVTPITEPAVVVKYPSVIIVPVIVAAPVVAVIDCAASRPFTVAPVVDRVLNVPNPVWSIDAFVVPLFLIASKFPDPHRDPYVSTVKAADEDIGEATLAMAVIDPPDSDIRELLVEPTCIPESAIINPELVTAPTVAVPVMSIFPTSADPGLRCTTPGTAPQLSPVAVTESANKTLLSAPTGSRPTTPLLVATNISPFAVTVLSGTPDVFCATHERPVVAVESACSTIPLVPLTGSRLTLPAPVPAMRSPLEVTKDVGIAGGLIPMLPEAIAIPFLK